MNVQEAKLRIEKELESVALTFGSAAHLVSYGVEIGKNEIDNGETDITYIFGSLALGQKDASEDDKIYLPLDAELNDDDTVDEDAFEKSLADFLGRVIPIRDRLVAAENPDEELKGVIADFDKELEENYQREMDRLNRVAKRNLTLAIIAVSVAAVAALLILVIDKIA